MLAATFLLLATCGDLSYFSNNYDGENLIGGHSLDEWQPDQDPASLPYMTFEEETDPADKGDTSLLPDGATEPVYRLEIRNLFQNGDFEATVAGNLPAQWTNNGATTAEAIDSGQNIDGVSFEILLGDASLTDVHTDLASVLADGFVTNATYEFYFDLRSQQETIGAEMNTSTGSSDNVQRWNMSRPSFADGTTLLRFPEDMIFDGTNTINAGDGTYDYFYFGGETFEAQQTMNAIIDNFRIARGDIPQFFRLPLQRSGSGRPDILSGGTFTVRLWVRDDPEEGANNRFRAEAVTMGVNLDPDISQVDPPHIAVVSRSDAAWSEWTEVSVEVPGGQLSDSSTDPVIEVVIAPGDLASGADAASILVASPQLYWAPD